MGKNVLQVIVWGSWFLISMTILNVSMQWLLVITGGLSTGIGWFVNWYRFRFERHHREHLLWHLTYDWPH